MANPSSNDGDLKEEMANNKRMACVECRQQKVRCDSYQKYPESCSRCTKKKLECVLQADFKRTSKRRRFKEMEQEVELLRRSVETQEHEKRRIVSGSLLDLSSQSTSGSPAPAGELPAARYVPRPRESAAPPPAVRLPELACGPKTIEDVTLSADTIADLFREFVDKYHPFLPVVEVARGPEEIHRLCPSLFWTIMAVASRRFDLDGELMMKLAPVLKSCLAEITISPLTRYVRGDTAEPFFNVASVYSVQAFLIYTMWPPLTSSLSADSSWNTSAVAISSAVRVGLHCPGYARDFSRVKADNPIYPKLSEQVRTWVCCNIVAQTVATVFGYPSFTSIDASVVSACQADSRIDIPEALKQMMTVQLAENEVEKTLNSNALDPLGLSELSERLSLIQILARKQDELEMAMGPLDDTRQFVLLTARVHLMTYYFLDNGGYSALQLQKGLVQAYNSAVALLDHAREASTRNRDFMKYLPGIYVQVLWQCSTIVNRVVHSPFAAYVDADIGRELYFTCVQLISRASILKHDMAYRAAEIMQQTWQLYDGLAKRPDKYNARISIRTRRAASIFFDTLWTMREEMGIRSVAPTILSQRNAEDGSRPAKESVYDPSAYHRRPKPDRPEPMSLPDAFPHYQGYAIDSQQYGPNGMLMPSASPSLPEQPQLNQLFDWDVDLVWRDVDMMMNDFGFQTEEVNPSI